MSLVQPNENEMKIKELQDNTDRLKRTLDLLALWYQKDPSVETEFNYMEPEKIFPTLMLRMLTLIEEQREIAIELGSPWVTIKQSKTKLNQLIKEKEKELQMSISEVKDQ